MERYPAIYLPASDSLLPLPRSSYDRFVAGRAAGAALALAEPAAEEQFSIRVEYRGTILEVLSEAAPTLINDGPVTGTRTLQHGDRIAAGSTAMIYLEKADPKLRKPPVPSKPAPVPAPPDPPATTRQPVTDLPAAPLEGLPTSTASKIDGASAGNRISAPGDLPLDRDAIIGRDRANVTLVLDHPRVSRRHAQVVVRGGRVSLRDLGSSNGTFVNGVRIEGYRVLQADDRIDIGPYSFRFTGRSLVQSTSVGNLRIVAYNLSRTVRIRGGAGDRARILDRVTLVVEPREFICILGPSGSGKSTLMHALSARAPADTGQVFLNNVSLYANFQALKQGIAFVPQQDVLHEGLTLRQALAYTAQLRLPPDTAGHGIEDAVDRALERVDLGARAHTVIGNLSGGQQKRASLANEIVSQPNLLFLDEVTSGLDEGTDWEMMKLFRRMADDGMTIVCVTHTVANVEDFCHKIVIMANPGVLAFYGSPAEARRYFRLDKLGDVYRVLATRRGEEWRDAYLASDECRRYVQTQIASAPPAAERAPVAADQDTFATQAAEAARQFAVLVRRYGALVFSDRRTLGLAAMQSLLVGVALAIVFGSVGEDNPKQSPLLFFLGVSCFWYGCNNAAKEIAKERAIYRLERDVNLSVISYVLSKMALLTVVGLGQVALLFAIAAAFTGIPGDASNQFFAMSVAMVAGTATGLLISAVANTTDQASTLIPIVLIPQILLAGVIVELPALANFLAHGLVSGFWIYKNMASVLAQDRHEVSLATFVLLLHTLVCFAASCFVLYVKDARGEMVYGKAIGKWVKQATHAYGQAQAAVAGGRR